MAKKKKIAPQSLDSEIRSTYLRVDACETNNMRYEPPRHLLEVSVVGDVAFLTLVSVEEASNTGTRYSNVGKTLAVDSNALIHALGFFITDFK